MNEEEHHKLIKDIWDAYRDENICYDIFEALNHEYTIEPLDSAVEKIKDLVDGTIIEG